MIDPDSFHVADRLYDAEWEARSFPTVPLSTAISQLADWEGAERAQETAVEFLSKGIWTAYARKAYFRSGASKTFPLSAFPQKLRSLEQARYLGKGAVANLGPGEIKREFWNQLHKSASNEWRVELDFLAPEGARIDLNRAEVEAVTSFYLGPLEDDEFLLAALTCYGVEISEHDVDATAPSKQQPANAKSRGTAFDWEGAFADVAARLYHDLEFPDVHALGVQAELIKALRESFEKNRLPVPEETSLKNKARRIVAALRAK